MEKESKNDRFKRVSDLRMRKFNDIMRLFRNLSNTQTYSYSESEVNEIISSMRREVDLVEDALNHRHSRPA